MRNLSRRFRSALFLALILAALVAVGICAAAEPLAGPVNIRFLWRLDEEADLNDFRGFWAGVLPNDGSERPQLAVIWSWDDQSFWPLWRIQLAADKGVLKEDDRVKPFDVVGPWSGMEAMTLTGGMPLPGHEYEICLSYDPELGGLSVAIEDLTAESQVVAASVAVSASAGPWRAATDLLSVSGAGKKDFGADGWSRAGLRSMGPTLACGGRRYADSIFALGAHRGSGLGVDHAPSVAG